MQTEQMERLEQSKHLMYVHICIVHERLVVDLYCELGGIIRSHLCTCALVSRKRHTDVQHMSENKSWFSEFETYAQMFY